MTERERLRALNVKLLEKTRAAQEDVYAEMLKYEPGTQMRVDLQKDYDFMDGLASKQQDQILKWDELIQQEKLDHEKIKIQKVGEWRQGLTDLAKLGLAAVAGVWYVTSDRNFQAEQNQIDRDWEDNGGVLSPSSKERKKDLKQSKAKSWKLF